MSVMLTKVSQYLKFMGSAITASCLAPEDDDPLENHSITQSMEQAHPPCMSNELS